MNLDVIFVDNHLLVVNKPAGILTQPSGTDQASIEAIAKTWIKEKYQKPGNVFLEAVHRIDKPVSGIVLFARTSKALSRLNESMRNKQSTKTYLALVEGVVSTESKTLEDYLIHDDFQAQIVNAKTPNAKLARLHYRVLKVSGNQSLLEIQLETGRYHQIRVQLSHSGHPIVGDKKYGSTMVWNDNGIALHHAKLAIPHPVTGEVLCFNAPSPFSDF